MKSVITSLIIVVLFIACSNSSSETATTKDTAKPAPVETKADFGAILLGYKNDPVCEMPVKNTSIEDTTIYNGKIIGFCNKGCKDEFIKTPENYVAVLKKAE